MAAIDKIYVTKNQFIKLEHWYNTMKEEGMIDTKLIPFNQYNLDINDWKDSSTDKPVWNLSVKADMWLLTNCPFDFVKKEIMSNYRFDEE